MTPPVDQSGVLGWWALHRRELPWRNTRDPWAVLVAEVMAQQTQVDRVVPRWHAFLGRWPTPTALATTPLAEVLRAWQGLGYPRRAANLHRSAQAVVADPDLGGELPSTLDGLLALPGIGPYTARAVLAFAHEADVGVVDTNSGRILARVGGAVMTIIHVMMLLGMAAAGLADLYGARTMMLATAIPKSIIT